MIKTAIIGCGNIAGGYDEGKNGEGVFSHAGAYKLFPEIEITAAYDPDKSRLEKFSKYWNVKNSFNSVDELLKWNYDVVSLCTPDNTHGEYLKKIIDSGCTKYIWAEKPFTNSYESAEQILNSAKSRKIGLWLSNQRRWEKAHMYVKNLIFEGAIGDIIHINGYYVKGITHIGCTMVDTIRFLCGDVNWCRAFAPFDEGSYGDDHSMRAVLGLSDDISACITGCDKKEYTYSVFELDIIASKGRIKIEENGDLISIYKLKDYDHYAGFKELYLSEKLETDMKWAMKHGLEMLIADLAKDRRSSCFAEEGMKDLQVVDAIKKSASQNGELIYI